MYILGEPLGWGHEYKENERLKLSYYMCMDDIFSEERDFITFEDVMDNVGFVFVLHQEF
jgi:hypothetical protein